MPSLAFLYLHTHSNHAIPLFKLLHHSLGFPKPWTWNLPGKNGNLSSTTDLLCDFEHLT